MFCKACRLSINFPDFNSEEKSYKGRGFCACGKYWIDSLIEDDEYSDIGKLRIINEEFIYDEYKLIVSYEDNLTSLFKDDVQVITIKAALDFNFRNKAEMLNKLDTFVNFS